MGDLVQREHPKYSGGIRLGVRFWAENLQYLWNGARYDQDYWQTNRKLHTHFQFVSKSITLNDRYALVQNRKDAFYGAQQKILNEDRPIVSAAKI